MNIPKVSVCIPTYNHKDYIEDCLLSVISQNTFCDMEILVGDDHSTDGTSDIVERLVSRYGSKIRHIRRENNIGPFRNLKALVREAKGKYIAHLDGDDFWQPGKINAQLYFLQHHPECSACYTNAWIVNNGLTPIGIFNNMIPIEFDLDFLLAKGNFLNHSSLLYRAEYRDCVMDSPELFIDYRIHIGLAMRGALGFINVPYVTYRHASAQSMIQRSTEVVRELYCDALVYAFVTSPTSRVYESAWEDFVARLVKDGLVSLDIRFLLRWYKRLSKDIEKSKVRIMSVGVILGLLRLSYAILGRGLIFFKITSQLKVANAR